MALKVNGLGGNELAAGDYLRKSVPESRWGDAWDVFKSNFGKIVLINIFVLITFLPGISIMLMRPLYLNALLIQQPNAAIIYPFYPDMSGMAESNIFATDTLFYSLLFIAALIASVGISGGAYSIKKLINTHGEFTVKSFFHGVRVCYFNTLLPVLIFMAFFYATVVIGDWKDLYIALGGSKGGAVTAYVFIIIATTLVGIYCGWLFAVGVSYRVKLSRLFKNSLVLMIGTPIQTVLMGAFSLIPVWLMLWLMPYGNLFSFLIAAVFILFGFSFVLISWMSFTQWAFDMFITPNLKAEKERAQANKSEKQLAQEKEDEDKRIARELLAAGKSELIARPILPVSDEAAITPLGATFTRTQIKGAAQEREKLCKDVSAYEKEHENDSVYVEYNKMFAEREKALQAPEGKKSKKKRVSADNLLK